MTEPVRTPLGTAELASHLGVHRNTVINWVRKGILVPDFWTVDGGYARWRRKSLPRLLRLAERRAA